jgi:hypothetical protein
VTCCAPQPDDLTPAEWAAQKNPLTATPVFPPVNPYLNPHNDPWKISTVQTVPIPPRTPYVYFVFHDPNQGGILVGRTFFECERTVCNFDEEKEMYLLDFSAVEYIGNLTDTPELFRLSHKANAANTPTEWQLLKQAQDAHFR